jgi:hypothetical protein
MGKLANYSCKPSEYILKSLIKEPSLLRDTADLSGPAKPVPEDPAKKAQGGCGRKKGNGIVSSRDDLRDPENFSNGCSAYPRKPVTMSQKVPGNWNITP